MKIDPPMWIVADFECMNIPVESNNKNFKFELFVNKPVAMSYNLVKNPVYENLNLEKDGYMMYQ